VNEVADEPDLHSCSLAISRAEMAVQIDHSTAPKPLEGQVADEFRNAKLRDRIVTMEQKTEVSSRTSARPTKRQVLEKPKLQIPGLQSVSAPESYHVLRKEVNRVITLHPPAYAEERDNTVIKRALNRSCR
jgi:hypothetical protein